MMYYLLRKLLIITSLMVLGLLMYCPFAQANGTALSSANLKSMQVWLGERTSTKPVDDKGVLLAVVELDTIAQALDWLADYRLNDLGTVTMVANTYAQYVEYAEEKDLPTIYTQSGTRNGVLNVSDGIAQMKDATSQLNANATYFYDLMSDKYYRMQNILNWLLAEDVDEYHTKSEQADLWLEAQMKQAELEDLLAEFKQQGEKDDKTVGELHKTVYGISPDDKTSIIPQTYDLSEETDIPTYNATFHPIYQFQLAVMESLAQEALAASTDENASLNGTNFDVVVINKDMFAVVLYDQNGTVIKDRANDFSITVTGNKGTKNVRKLIITSTGAVAFSLLDFAPNAKNEVNVKYEVNTPREYRRFGETAVNITGGTLVPVAMPSSTDAEPYASIMCYNGRDIQYTDKKNTIYTSRKNDAEQTIAIQIENVPSDWIGRGAVVSVHSGTRMMGSGVTLRSNSQLIELPHQYCRYLSYDEPLSVRVRVPGADSYLAIYYANLKVEQGRDDGSTNDPRDETSFAPGFTLIVPSFLPLVGGEKVTITPPGFENFTMVIDVSGKMLIGYSAEIDQFKGDIWKSENSKDYDAKVKEAAAKNAEARKEMMNGINNDARKNREWGMIGSVKLRVNVGAFVMGNYNWMTKSKNYGEVYASAGAYISVTLKVNIAKTIFAGPVPILLGFDVAPTITFALNAFDMKWNFNKPDPPIFRYRDNPRMIGLINAGVSLGFGISGFTTVTGRVYFFLVGVVNLSETHLEKALLGMGVEVNLQFAWAKINYKIWDAKPIDLLKPGEAQETGVTITVEELIPGLPPVVRDGYDVDTGARNANLQYEGASGYEFNIDPSVRPKVTEYLTSLGAPYTETEIYNGSSLDRNVKFVKINGKVKVGGDDGHMVYAFWLSTVKDGWYTYSRVAYAGFFCGDNGRVETTTHSGFIEPPRVNGTFLYYAYSFDVAGYYMPSQRQGDVIPHIVLSICYGNTKNLGTGSIDYRTVKRGDLADMSVQVIEFVGDTYNTWVSAPLTGWASTSGWLMTNKGKRYGEYRYLFGSRVSAIDNFADNSAKTGAIAGCASYEYAELSQNNGTTRITAVDVKPESIKALQANDPKFEKFESPEKFNLFEMSGSYGKDSFLDFNNYTFLLHQYSAFGATYQEWFAVFDAYIRSTVAKPTEFTGESEVFTGWLRFSRDGKRDGGSFGFQREAAYSIASDPYIVKLPDGTFFHGGVLGIMRSRTETKPGVFEEKYTLVDRQLVVQYLDEMKYFSCYVKKKIYDFTLPTSSLYYCRDYATGQIILSWVQRFEKENGKEKPNDADSIYRVMGCKYFEEKDDRGDVTFSGFTKPYPMSDAQHQPIRSFWPQIGVANGSNMYFYAKETSASGDFKIVAHQFTSTNKLAIIGANCKDPAIFAGEQATFQVALRSIGSWPLYKAKLTFKIENAQNQQERNWQAEVDINLRKPRANTIRTTEDDKAAVERDYRSVYRMPSLDFMSDVYRTVDITPIIDRTGNITGFTEKFGDPLYSRVILPEEVLTVACLIDIPTWFKGVMKISVEVGGEQVSANGAINSDDATDNFGYILKDGELTGLPDYGDSGATTDILSYTNLNVRRFNVTTTSPFALNFNDLSVTGTIISIQGVRMLQATVGNQEGLTPHKHPPTLFVSVDGIKTYQHTFKNHLPGQHAYTFTAPLVEVTGGRTDFEQLMLSVSGHGTMLNDVDRSFWDSLDENGDGTLSMAEAPISFNEFSTADNRFIFGADTFFRITQQPADAHVDIGEIATFSVRTYGGTYPHHYQWQRRPDDTREFADIPGATYADYTTPPVEEEHYGYQFRCVTSDSAGIPAAEISDIATLLGITLPLTGDDHRSAILIMLMLVSIIAMVVFIKRKGDIRP